jgi:type II secretory pathway component PulF
MEPQPSKSDLMQVAEALSSLRDTWVSLAMALRDLQYETPSPERDKAMEQVEQHLARIKTMENGSLE